jgi:hypothetical protein
MLAGLKNGEFTAVICWHPDRLYRSLKDLERLIDIADATSAEICSVNGGDIDLSTATGKMIARILGSVSRQESEHKAERQRRANEQRRANGRWAASGRVPFGYTKVGSPGNYTIVPSEPEASMVRKAAADVLAGASLRSICREWNAQGVRTRDKAKRWRGLMLRQVLMNPVNAALLTTPLTRDAYAKTHRRGAVCGDGDWEPLLDRATYDGLVAMLTDPARTKRISFERKFIGSGVYICGRCGGKMYARPQIRDRVEGKAGGYVTTYVCLEYQHMARQGKALDDYVEQVVLGILSQSGIRARLVDSPDVDIDELRTRRAALTARADELARMFAAGAIDGSQLGSGTAGLRTQIAEVDRVLAGLAASSPALVLLDGDPDELIDRWQASPPDIKGKIIAELCAVTVLPCPPGLRRFSPEYIDIAPRR